MANTKYVLMHKASKRYLGPKSKVSWRNRSGSTAILTVANLDDARVFSTLSAAHNCEFISKDVDTSVFYKNRVHVGDNFEYVAIPVKLTVIDD